MDTSHDLERLVYVLAQKVESLEERCRHQERTISSLRSDLIRVAIVAGGGPRP